MSDATLVQCHRCNRVLPVRFRCMGLYFCSDDCAVRTMIHSGVPLATISDAEFQLSERARSILRDAAALDDSAAPREGRFVVELGSHDHEICQALAHQLLMVQLTPIDWPMQPTFRVTDKGRQIAQETANDA